MTYVDMQIETNKEERAIGEFDTHMAKCRQEAEGNVV